MEYFVGVFNTISEQQEAVCCREDVGKFLIFFSSEVFDNVF
jgi:hypothetical protein